MKELAGLYNKAALILSMIDSLTKKANQAKEDNDEDSKQFYLSLAASYRMDYLEIVQQITEIQNINIYGLSNAKAVSPVMSESMVKQLLEGKHVTVIEPIKS